MVVSGPKRLTVRPHATTMAMMPGQTPQCGFCGVPLVQHGHEPYMTILPSAGRRSKQAARIGRSIGVTNMMTTVVVVLMRWIAPW